MSDQLICRVGAALPDRDMRHYDPRTKQLVTPSWVPRTFDEIREPLRQLAASSGDFKIPEYTPISNQGNAGSCVANGCSDAFEILQGVQYGSTHVQQLARRWLYYIARQYTGDTDRDAGTYVSAALHQLQTVGTFEERFFPYTDDPDYIVGNKARPELDCYTMASNNRISGFYRLDPHSPSYLDDMESAIRALHPVIFGMKVGQEFQQYQAGQVLGPTANPIGGHCTILVGVSYDGPTRRWIDRNSWSSAWGDAGHCLLSDACMLTANDVWVATTSLKSIR